MDPYRTPALAPAAPRSPAEEHVVHHVTMGLVGLAFGLATLAAGLALQTRETFECRRQSPQAAPTCAIVTHRLVGTTRAPVRASKYVMSVGEMTLNSDDGTRLYLRIDREGAPQAVYKAEASEDLPQRFARYLDSSELVLERPLASLVLTFLPLTLGGLFLVVLGVLRFRPGTRLRWEPIEDTLSVEARRWRRPPEVRRFAMKDVSRPQLVEDPKQENLHHLVVVVAGRNTRLVAGGAGQLVTAMRKVDKWLERSAARRQAKKAAEAES